MGLRREKGLSPNQLGYLAGVAGKTIRKAELGISEPLPHTQLRIATVFGMSPLDIWPLEMQRKVAA